jgi:hypothetical protein
VSPVLGCPLLGKFYAMRIIYFPSNIFFQGCVFCNWWSAKLKYEVEYTSKKKKKNKEKKK